MVLVQSLLDQMESKLILNCIAIWELYLNSPLEALVYSEVSSNVKYQRTFTVSGLFKAAFFYCYYRRHTAQVNEY